MWHLFKFAAPGVFYACLYNHARRLRLEKLLHTELSRSPNRYFKPLLDPGGGVSIEHKYIEHVSGLDGVWTPQLFHTRFYTVTTPIVSALKNYYTCS
jgi:hypothetical protein